MNIESLRRQLCNTLCGAVEITTLANGHLSIITPFTFPDGDTFQIYLDNPANGAMQISDHGHTFMQLSYEHDVDDFFKGTRGELLDGIYTGTGVREEGGSLILPADETNLGAAILLLSQAITQIYDLTYLSRPRVASTFYEDLQTMLYSLVSPEHIKKNYIVPKQEHAEDYIIDYRIETKHAPVFLFGVPTADKAKLTALILEYWMRRDVQFSSLAVCADAAELPKGDLRRLINSSDAMINSLEARADLRRKLEMKAALN